MLFSKGNLVGLDIGSSCVKAVQLTSTHKGLSLSTLAIENMPAMAMRDGEFFDCDLVASVISRIYKKHRIKNKNVALALSGPSVNIKKISIQHTSDDELNERVRWEADQYLSFDANDAYVDFQILPTMPGAKKIELLLVAAKKNM